MKKSIIETTSGNQPVIRIQCKESSEEMWAAQEVAQRIHALASMLYRELDTYSEEMEVEDNPDFVVDVMAMLQALWEADFQLNSKGGESSGSE